MNLVNEDLETINMVNKENGIEAMTKIQFKTIVRNEIRDQYKESTLPLLPYQEGEGEL